MAAQLAEVTAIPFKASDANWATAMDDWLSAGQFQKVKPRNPTAIGQSPFHCQSLMIANYDKPGDRDIASYGVVRMLGETRWEPKKVFHAMAARYERR